MEWKFDSTGFKFIVKFIGQLVLLYFLTAFFSSFIFSNIYENREYVSKNRRENLAAVISQEILPDKTKKQRGIVLGFVGDIMLDRGVEDVVLSNCRGDFKFVFNHAKEELNSVDLLIGNLEGPISSRGKNVGSAYSFRMDTRVVSGLKFAGFDALSVANNHSGDWGKEAFSDTLLILREANIIPVGATTSPEIFEVKGLRLGLLAFSDFPGLGIRADDEVVEKSVSEARGAADFVVAYFHFGDEYQKEPSLRQIKLAKIAIDAGARLVVGSHPHVTQGMEKYKEGFIFYSLGNFVFDQYFSDETMRGWLLKVSVESNGEVSDLELCDVFINSLFQPVILPCKSVLNF